jgi:hypothetical protein
MRESDVQKKIKKFLEGHGALVFKNQATLFAQRGIPDLTVILNGVVIFAEIKTETGVISKMQEKMQQEIRNHGGNSEVWYHLGDARKWAEKVLGKTLP